MKRLGSSVGGTHTRTCTHTGRKQDVVLRVFMKCLHARKQLCLFLDKRCSRRGFATTSTELVPHQDAGSFGDQLGRRRQLRQVHAGQQPVDPGVAAHPLAEGGGEGQRVLRGTERRVRELREMVPCRNLQGGARPSPAGERRR